jgi:hypothetical protein
VIHIQQEDFQRFFKYVEILPNGCWFWTGARSRGKGNKKWYGSFRVGQRVVRAHRFACDMVGKACPPGHHRDHSCVFSLCVNPFHIDVIPKEDNQRLKLERRGDNGLVFKELVEVVAAVHPHLDIQRLLALQ